MNGKNYPVTTKQTLLKNSSETCEFCDKTFTNRYESLIHNATHIIIPLLKKNFIMCSKCDYQCSSQADLQKHTIIEHPLIIKTEKLALGDFEKENIKVEDDKYTSNLESIGLQNDINDFPEDSSGLFITNETLASIKKEIHSPEKPIRDRLVFETDNYLDEISDSFNLNSKQMPDDDDDDINVPLILFTNKHVDNELPESHNDSLKRPNSVFCRYCSAMFLTRFSLIKHEQKHIKFKQKIMGMLCLHCDKYIAGDYSNLTSHIEAKHSKDKYKVYCTSVCKMCGLQYRSHKHHIHNYHSTKCCNINKFVTDNNFKNHLDKCLCHTHVLSVCRPCYTVLKEDNKFKCLTLGIKRMNGVVEDCKKCDRKVNEIISVKLSCKVQTKYQYWYVQDRPLSNKDRLKNIRMRLKKLNILSKMYCFVLICASFSSLVLDPYPNSS